MPTIEIMSVRFNLDKEEDSKLFEELAKHVPAGKKNEFLKQLLYDHFMKNGTVAVKAKTVPKKQAKVEAGVPEKVFTAAQPEKEHPPSPAAEAGSEPAPAATEGRSSLDEHQPPAETSSEASSLAATFVQ